MQNLQRQLSAFIILIFIASVTLNVQAQDCKRFRNGNYKMVYPNLGTAIIKRNGNTQTETLASKNLSMTFTVRWLNDCTYTLTPTAETFRKYPNVPMNAIITVRITKTSKSSYTQISTANYLKTKTTGEMIKTD